MGSLAGGSTAGLGSLTSSHRTSILCLFLPRGPGGRADSDLALKPFTLFLLRTFNSADSLGSDLNCVSVLLVFIVNGHQVIKWQFIRTPTFISLRWGHNEVWNKTSRDYCDIRLLTIIKLMMENTSNVIQCLCFMAKYIINMTER